MTRPPATGRLADQIGELGQRGGQDELVGPAVMNVVLTLVGDGLTF